jgi:hypothetical protein
MTRKSSTEAEARAAILADHIKSDIVRDYILDWVKEDHVAVLSIQRMLNSLYGREMKVRDHFTQRATIHAINSVDDKTLVHQIHNRRLEFYKALGANPIYSEWLVGKKESAVELYKTIIA